MTKIKLCGLSRTCDIEVANELNPEYIGFVFAPKSKRYVSPEKAVRLKELLCSDIKAVGVFVNESLKTVEALLKSGVIDMAQLHGNEGEEYIRKLRTLTGKPVIKAFRVGSEQDVRAAHASTADYVLLDLGAGTGTVFDWNLISKMDGPYFLAGGLDAENVREALQELNPFAVDVSSGVETEGIKDKIKMAEFVAAVRGER